MFWQRFRVEKSGWHNVMLFTEECDALSSLSFSHSTLSFPSGLPMSFFHRLSFTLSTVHFFFYFFFFFSLPLSWLHNQAGNPNAIIKT